MFRKVSSLLIGLALFLLASTTVSAKSYVLGSAGLQFDLGQLGGTITKDGLNASVYNPSLGSEYLIPPENRLVALQKSAPALIKNKQIGGAMTGLVLSVGFEQDFADYFFYRVEANYTNKLMGGRDQTQFLGVNIYNATWNYQSWVIPVNVGIKLKVGEDSAVYIGGGINYYQGGWTLKGMNDTSWATNPSSPLAALGNPLFGTFAKIPTSGSVPSGGGAYNGYGINAVNQKFTTRGFGFNWLLGAQTKVSDKGSIFFELETIIAGGGQGTTHTLNPGIAQGLSAHVAYPVVLAGQIYRVGYKHEL